MPIHDQCQPGMSKSIKTICTALSQFCHWTCIVHIPGNTMGNSFFTTTWTYGFCGFVLSFGTPAQWKSAWTDARMLTKHFDTKYGWIQDDCGKNRRLKLGLLGGPLSLYYSSHFCISRQVHAISLVYSVKVSVPIFWESASQKRWIQWFITIQFHTFLYFIKLWAVWSLFNLVSSIEFVADNLHSRMTKSHLD